MSSRNPKQLILILGDQLTATIAALRAADAERDVVLLAEVQQEATYVRHHKKEIAFLFSAMRHFAEELSGAGWGHTIGAHCRPGSTRQDWPSVFIRNGRNVC
jgi:deoxyribodipyrimidine photolyase-related protein